MGYKQTKNSNSENHLSQYKSQTYPTLLGYLMKLIVIASNRED